jgi:hypothetical protein
MLKQNNETNNVCVCVVFQTITTITDEKPPMKYAVFPITTLANDERGSDNKKVT